MDALQTIQTRHSVGRVKPDDVPRELIEKLLNTAVQAPIIIWSGPGVRGLDRKRTQ